MLEALALLVLLVLCTGAIWLVVIIGRIPGAIARGAGHPQTEAINTLAWIGLLTAGIGWVAALVWAKTKPLGVTDELEQRVRALESRTGEPGAGS